MKFKDIVICSDLDGTMLNEQNAIPKVNLEAIEYFRSEGGKIILATGRFPGAVIPAIDGFLPDYPCICHNGCSMYDLAKDEYVEITALDDDVVEVADEIIRLFPTAGIEIMNKEGMCVPKRNFATDRHAEYEKIASTTADGVRNTPKPWIKMVAAEDPDVVEEIKRHFSDSPFREKYNMLQAHKFYYEIFNKTAGKGDTLKRLCEKYGINLKNVIAIGDNENDITMLDVAGTAVAVSNAHSEVKAHADFITCSNEDGAIADLIGRL